MPLVTQILCDGCKTTKKETNHWYAITIHQRSLEVGPLKLQPDGRPHAERDGLLQYFCGRYCVLEALNKWMDELNTESSPDPAQSKNGRLLFRLPVS
jgi:hypothetical protein